MRNFSDDPAAWDSEAAYMPMAGLGADTVAAPAESSAPAWWQNLITTAGNTYATVKNAQTAAKSGTGATAPVAVSSGGISSNAMLMIGAAGLGALLIYSMAKRKRR